MQHSHEEHAHENPHQPTQEVKLRPLAIAFGITVAFLIIEVMGGLLTNSLALLADAGHMLTDAAALALSLFAVCTRRSRMRRIVRKTVRLIWSGALRGSTNERIAEESVVTTRYRPARKARRRTRAISVISVLLVLVLLAEEWNGAQRRL